MSRQEHQPIESFGQGLLAEYKDNHLVSHFLEVATDDRGTERINTEALVMLLARAHADPLLTHSVDDLLSSDGELAFGKIDWKRLGAEFLRRFLIEARNRICDSKKRSKSLNSEITNVKKAVPAIAAALASWLGANEPVSIGLATLALYLIIETTHGTFCSMTDEKVIREILDRVEQDASADADKPRR